MSAVLTADAEIHADDFKYHFRKTLREVLKYYGIEPTSQGADGLWEPPDEKIEYHRIHYSAMQSEADEVVRFIWHNRAALNFHEEAYTRVVRILDTVLNNTSVILLFEFCGKKLLFPGHAQKENWAYALSKPDICDFLKDVDLYKVGHHGSLNATPHSLWNLLHVSDRPTIRKH